MAKQQFRKGIIQQRTVKAPDGTTEQVKELVRVVKINGKKVVIRKQPNIVSWVFEGKGKK